MLTILSWFYVLSYSCTSERLHHLTDQMIETDITVDVSEKTPLIE